MNLDATRVLGLGASALLAGGAVSLATACLRAHAIRARLAAYERRLARDLRYLRTALSARHLVRAQLWLSLLLLALVVTTGAPHALACLPAIARVPLLCLRWARARRTACLEQQLDTWLVVLANALRATPSLGEALAASAERMAPPLREELQLVCNEVRLGVSLDRALQQAAARIDSPLVRAAFATLRIARNSGGDLSRTLDASAASLREMARLHGVLRAKTAEGRAQSLLIALLPAPLIGLLETLSPDLLRPLWTTARGHLVVAAAAALWLCAVLAARRITAVEI